MKKIEMAMQVLENYVHYQNIINYDRENDKRESEDLSCLTAINILAVGLGWKITPFGKDINGKWFFLGAVITAKRKNIGLWALRYSTFSLHDFKEEFKADALKRFDEIEFMFDNAE